MLCVTAIIDSNIASTFCPEKLQLDKCSSLGDKKIELGEFPTATETMKDRGRQIQSEKDREKKGQKREKEKQMTSCKRPSKRDGGRQMDRQTDGRTDG